MASTVHIDSERDFDVASVLEPTRRAMGRLLGVAIETPLVIMEKLDGGDVRCVVNGQGLYPRETFCVIEAPVLGAAAYFHGNEAVEGDVRYVTVGTWGRSKTCFVLAAAVACAIAEILDARMSDGGIWVADGGKFSPGDFERAFKENPVHEKLLASVRRLDGA